MKNFSVLLFLAYFFWLGFFTSLHGIDISPTRYQGGTTNDPPNKTEGAPSLLKSPFKWIFSSIHSEAMKRVSAPPNFKVDLYTEPKTFNPLTNAVLKARMIVVNRGKDKYVLEFMSAQHHDFIISQKDGKEVYRWSSDKTFSQQMSSMLLNYNEKLIYEGELFSSSNQVINLPPGEYKLIGKITSKIPISVESSFQVLP